MTDHDDSTTESPEDVNGNTRSADDTEEVQPTGVRAADEARARLADVDDAPLDEHVEVFEDVHRRLHEGLADLDES